MKITVNEITGKTYEQMKTELMFFIASAKSLGYELIRLNIEATGDDKRETMRSHSLSRLLATVKRRGFIELYIKVSELTDSSTEAKYLRNKFPEITGECDESSSYVLKLMH